MRKVIVCNIVSLDGYYAATDGNPLVLPMDEAFDAYNLERMQAAGSVLLGRTSYEGFSSYWPDIADAPADPDNRALSDNNRELSRIYNRLEKTVVSDSYQPSSDNPWYDTTTVVKRGDAADWVADARREDGGDILMYGSHVLWNSLLTAGLVDELHLMVGAVVLGEGTPAFMSPVDGLTLLDCRRFEGSDNVVLRYQAATSTG
jgi:dihydrofolate reductase